MTLWIYITAIRTTQWKFRCNIGRFGDDVEYFSGELSGTSRLLLPLDVLTIGYLARDFDGSITLGVYFETKENLLNIVFVGLRLDLSK